MDIKVSKEEFMKYKTLLKRFLSEKGVDVDINAIRHTGSWEPGELEVGHNIYSVDDIRHIRYGRDWYRHHEYKDYGFYRVSMSYHIFRTNLGNNKAARRLSIACTDVYTWRPRVENYKKKTPGQIHAIVDTYMKSYVKDGCPGNADLGVLRRTLDYELSKLYLKLWFEK